MPVGQPLASDIRRLVREAMDAEALRVLETELRDAGTPIDGLDILFIENVGNLVCPAEFYLGEALKVMVFSVVEGAEKPKKYPVMFHEADAVILNKIDLKF